MQLRIFKQGVRIKGEGRNQEYIMRVQPTELSFFPRILKLVISLLYYDYSSFFFKSLTDISVSWIFNRR